MNIVQYIIANKGANMSPGKLAAQVAHASVVGYVNTTDEEIKNAWWATGHTKIVLEARDNDHLQWARVYLTLHGIDNYMIIDEGRTEVASMTPTALGFPLLDKDDEKVQFAFSTFRTYREDKPKIETRKRWWSR